MKHKKTFQSLSSKIKRLYVIPHTHGDLSWADIPDLCINACVACLQDTLEFQKKFPGFKFTMEHALYLEEYLRRYPENKEKIQELLHRGVLECGGFFTGPTELLLGGEGLIRELIYGKYFLQQNFDTRISSVWNVDCPGHTLQMPQILSKAGIKYFVIFKDFSHFPKNFGGYDGPSLFSWRAPDGSRIRCCHTPIIYAATQPLGFRTSYEKVKEELPKFIQEHEKHLVKYNLPGMVMLADGADIQRPSKTVADAMDQWNRDYKDIRIQFATTEQYFKEIEKWNLEEYEGEMPCWWDTVQVCELERGLRDKRLEGKLMAAETFSLVSHLLTGTEYPKEDLDIAWKYRLMVNEHNWGGCNWGYREGEISDEIQTGQIKAAEIICLRSLRAGCLQIAGNILDVFTTDRIVVFNPNSWDRKDMVEQELKFEDNTHFEIGLLDERQKEISLQILSRELNPNGSIKKIKILFIADVPALGYNTYTLTGKNSLGSREGLKSNGILLENRFYKLEINPKTGGISRLWDKRKEIDLLQTGKWEGNEIIVHEDKGFDECEMLTGKFWSSKESPCQVYLSEQGPVRATITVKGAIEGGYRIQEISLFNELDKIDLTTILQWNGTIERQVMLMFPMGTQEGKLHYEVPFGTVEWGKEHPRHIKIHPSIRGVRNWVNISSNHLNLTLASEVIPIDFKDRTPNPAPGYTLQPILLRSVYSCGVVYEKGVRNFYFKQEGEHRYRFSLKSHQGEFIPHVATQIGWEHNNPLIPILPQSRVPFLHIMPIEKSRIGDIPLHQSFCKIDKSNVIVLLMKQSENGKNAILRMYETDGKETTVTLHFPFPVKQALQTNLLEHNLMKLPSQDNSIQITLGKFAIESVRINFQIKSKERHLK